MIFSKQSLFASLLVFALSSAVFADFSASDFVNQFNSLNSGQGIIFTNTSSSSERQINFTSGTTKPDLSAYVLNNTTGTAGATGSYLRTFCVEPSGSTAGTNYGVLSYSGGRSSVESASSAYNGKTVNLGTAVLYSQFASGNLASYDYSGRSTSSTLITAIRATMGVTTVSNWSSNVFLNQLLAINSSQSYWMSAYDPNNYYSQVGDYAVFVLNVTNDSGGNMQDYLYVTEANYGNGGDGVPEPATLLLWSLGGLTCVGAKLRERKLRKYTAERQ